MLKRWFKPRGAQHHGHQLYLAVVAAARNPAFYRDLGVTDRIDARFELYTLHVVLLLRRLNAEGQKGKEISQALFDVYVGALDDSLRELGVGDLSVAKKMRKLGEALYGRAKAYEDAFGQDDDEALAALIGRTVFGADSPDHRAHALAAHVRAATAALAAQDFDAVLAAPAFPEPEIAKVKA